MHLTMPSPTGLLDNASSASGGQNKLRPNCQDKLPSLICRPVGTQFMSDDVIALFEFEQAGDEIRVVSERHYRLVTPDALTDEDLVSYRRRLFGGT